MTNNFFLNNAFSYRDQRLTAVFLCGVEPQATRNASCSAHF